MTFISHRLRKLTFVLFATSLGFAPSVFAQEPRAGEPEPPKIIRKSGGVLQGSATRRVEPAYPPLAQAAQISGSVVVEVTVDEEGKVISARAISGHPLLKDAAVTAARGWTFTPTRLQGTPVKVLGTITFNFNLGDGPDGESKELEVLNEQLRADPSSPETYYKLGRVYSRHGQYDKAIEAFNNAVQRKSDYAESLYELGTIYRRLQRFDDAAEALNRAAGFMPDNAAIHLELSAVYMDTDRDDDAIAAARRVLKLNPSADQAEASYLVIGFLLVRNGRFDEAVEIFKEGAKLDGNKDHFHLYLGKAYSSAGQGEMAMQEYRFLKEKNSPLASELLSFINKQR
jgi:TonB family protein